MNIIELHPGINQNYVNSFGDIYFYEKDDPTVEDMIEDANKIYRYLGIKERTAADMIRNWLWNTNYLEKTLVQTLKVWYIDEEEWENYTSIDDFIDEASGYFLQEMFVEKGSRETLVSFFEANDLQLLEVGSGLCLAASGVYKSFIRDLYEGWNFFCISSLDEEGKPTDWSDTIYLGDSSRYTLEYAAKDYFGFDDFYLVESNYSKNFDHKKVMKVPYTAYSFVELGEINKNR